MHTLHIFCMLIFQYFFFQPENGINRAKDTDIYTDFNLLLAQKLFNTIKSIISALRQVQPSFRSITIAFKSFSLIEYLGQYNPLYDRGSIDLLILPACSPG